MISAEYKLTRKYIGDIGEVHAVNCLKKLRFHILERSLKTDIGEIDIIALKGRTLHFIEVKTSDIHSAYTPEMHMNIEKRKQYIKLSRQYLKYLELSRDFPSDFFLISYDLFSVYVDRKTETVVKEKFTENIFFPGTEYDANNPELYKPRADNLI